MISLDNVILLEQKVESAVAKIQQLQAENDALRNKCSELTNALSAKSEQLDTFTLDQNRIESGILKALNRLNSIENTVLNAASQASAAPVTAKPQAPVQPAPAPQAAPVVQPQVTPVPETPVEPVIPNEIEIPVSPVNTTPFNMPEDSFNENEGESEQTALDSFFEGTNTENVSDDDFEQEESFNFFDQTMPQTEDDMNFGSNESESKPEIPGFDIF